ncbi:MAG: FAD-dependent oxidoreductase [Vicinamibacteria bacterium]|nr:FAD-dependent oxidoreductase [Vicinamibacteria bacterium]
MPPGPPANDARRTAWDQLEGPLDLLVIGGGIVGAGVFSEAARRGFRVALVERHDFAWGTSSRSSKLVHGGMRYLRQGRLFATLEAVRERERLLRELAGLVVPLRFVAVARASRPTLRWELEFASTIYALGTGRWTHRFHAPAAAQALVPGLSGAGLVGAVAFDDAATDDARLVLRVLAEGRRAGGLALNQVEAVEVLVTGGRVRGARLRDRLSGAQRDLHARVVVSATGAEADALRAGLGAPQRLRPLRGSHIVIPAARLPLGQAVALHHVRDRRPIYAIPWQGVSLVGTTDLDHELPLGDEPAITPQEVDYLFEGLAAELPSVGLGPADVIATFAGVRGVLGTGARPSDEARSHHIWDDRGLLTVASGKLTTFRRIAREVLARARRRLPSPAPPVPAAGAGAPVAGAEREVSVDTWARLVARYGGEAAAVAACARPGELESIAGLPMSWAELRHAARAESVVHLDDLLLRRVRLGLSMADGGRAALPRVQALCAEELGWDDARWRREQADYLALWAARYSLPGTGTSAASARGDESVAHNPASSASPISGYAGT